MRRWTDNHVNFDYKHTRPMIYERAIETLHDAKLVRNSTMESRRKNLDFMAALFGSLVHAYSNQLILAIKVCDERDGVTQERKVAIIKSFVKSGLIKDVRRGYRYDKAKSLEEGRAAYDSTKLEPSEKVLEWLDGESVKVSQRHRITFKREDGVTKNFKPKDAKEAGLVKMEQDILESASKQAVKRVKGADVTEGFTRKYSDAAGKEGGRIYGNYQNMPKEQRAKITIDGEETVELDFPENHVKLLAASAGIKHEENMYDAFSHLMTRKEAKRAIMVVLNSENPRRTLCDMRFESPFRWRAAKYEAFMEIIESKFTWLKDAAGNQIGKTLQKVEGDIALSVMRILQNKNEICLPVHDSFIVKKSIAPLAQKVMDGMWESTVADAKKKWDSGALQRFLAAHYEKKRKQQEASGYFA